MARQEINAVSVFARGEIMVSRDAHLHVQTGILLQAKAAADNLYISRILPQEVIRQVDSSCLADLFLRHIHGTKPDSGSQQQPGSLRNQ